MSLLRLFSPRSSLSPRFSPILSSLPTQSQRRTYARMTLIGHLGAPPELHTTPTGKEVVRYVVASNSGSPARNNQSTSWFKVALIEPREGIRDLLTGLDKGTMVHVEADVSVGTYQDEMTKKNHNSYNLVQRNIEVLKRPNSQDQGSESQEMVGEGMQT